MSVPTDNNILLKEHNKISKNKNQEIETEKNWHLKTTTTGTLGIIKKGTDKYNMRYLAVSADIRY